MLVCHCLAINDSTIKDLCVSGAHSAEEIGVRCGAGTECGGCIDRVRQLTSAQRASVRRPVS